MPTQPGLIILLGSGETSPNIRKVYDWLFAQLEEQVRVAILETPAGFEPNSEYVAQQIQQYIEKRLQNYAPSVVTVPARRRDTAHSPDDPALMELLYDANVILMGPGSPTYAVRQLAESVAWHTLRACHRLGAALIFASATTLASSGQTLPVYEIYKVGEDLHWKRGLDFFRDFGLDLVFISHWNNNDGGDVLDTSRCYMGQARYEQLVEMLPINEAGGAYTIVGIDENTALILDPATATCQVMGAGGVVLIRDEQERRFESGDRFEAEQLGDFRLPDAHAGIPCEVWQRTQDGMARARAALTDAPQPTPEILQWVEQRDAARTQKDWARADQLRDRIEAAGWRVLDTPDGQKLEPM